MQNKQVIVIGAGLSGLVCAYRLQSLGVDCLLIEKSNRVGGVIQSERFGEYLIERGANSAQGTPELLALIEELGITNEILEGNPNAPAYVYFAKQLLAVPMSPPALIKSNLLSLGGKLRLLGEPFIHKREAETEESVYDFFQRRLGVEIAERLVAPFVSGIYAGDEKALSIQAAFPMLANLEREYGSLFLGAIKKGKAAKKAKTISQSNGQVEKPKRRRSISFREGMKVLPATMAAKLNGNLIVNSEDISITHAPESNFVVQCNYDGSIRQIACHHLIFATPSQVAASLLKALKSEVDIAASYSTIDEICSLLGEIDYPPMTILYLAYDRSAIAHTLDGFGFLAVPQEGLNILGCIFSSSQFSGRAPQDKALFTIFIGGARNPELTTLDDYALVSKAHDELQKILGISAAPEVISITRWQRAIPQYNLGHAARIHRIEALTSPVNGLHLLGNYLHGVSVGDCVKAADSLAHNVYQSLRG